MSDHDLHLFLDERFDELPQDILDRAIAILNNELSDEMKAHLSSAIDTKGRVTWADDIHFTLGMDLRNILRKHGLYEKLLPTENWDDYYIQCVEAALGKRTKCEVN